MTMTASPHDRTWIQDTLAHRPPRAVPYNFMFSPPARACLEAHCRTSDLETTLGMPLRFGGTKSIKPLYAPPAEFGPRIQDEFGVVWSTSDIDRGSPIGPCLTEPDLSGYRFPDPSAAYRFEHLADWTAANAEHYTILVVGDLWERATFMRGDLIDLGLDILHPIQPEAMDILDLKRRFGPHLTFCGGLRTQDLLPRGTPEQIRGEVRRLKDAMGAGGGYILEPGITLQADVPLANLLAMIDEANVG
jgi:uroporphyrinogen decarboxylase